jgi:murein L,D-transpeptidase YafK
MRVKTYEIALGWQPEGKKRFEGDGKTPEGVYVIHDKNPHSGYHKKLGISYPNQEDLDFAESQEKSAGGLIKIHGIRNGIGWIGRKHLLFDWTNGCIAVTDMEIDELYEEIEIGTPIEILP